LEHLSEANDLASRKSFEKSQVPRGTRIAQSGLIPPWELIEVRVRKRLAWSLTVAVIATSVLSLSGSAQTRAPRRSGPRDWSHGRLVASGWGSQDPAVRRDWRTLRKHLQIEDAAAQRTGQQWMAWMRQGGLFRRPPASSSAGQSSSDVKLDWSLNTGGTGAVTGYPAKYSFDISSANCSDVIYFTVNHTGTSTRPNVIAMTNPYVGCPGNPLNLTPTVKWALRLPYGVPTSATISFDGTILYVIESRPQANGGPILHAIRVNNITTNTGTYNYNTGAWSGVHMLGPASGAANAEQLFELAFSGTSNTTSSPFLDYATNRIYFGDASGRIHRINTVSSTTAAQAPGWPIACGTAAHESPVAFDNHVISGSADGRLYRIDTSAGSPACIASMQAGGGTAEGAAGGLTSPLVDVTNGRVIVATGDTSLYDYKAIGVFNLAFAAGEWPTTYAILGSANGVPAQFPALDDAFWTTNDGNLYAVGSADTSNTLLMRIPYNGVSLLPAEGHAQLRRTGAASNVATSPVAEFLTAASVSNPDFIFVGGNATNYRFMNRISSGFAGTPTSPVSMASYFGTASGISSGISIDTRTTATTGTTATANIYFGTAGGAVVSTIVQLAQQF
jgi:hypothetical protein